VAAVLSPEAVSLWAQEKAAAIKKQRSNVCKRGINFIFLFAKLRIFFIFLYP